MGDLQGCRGNGILIPIPIPMGILMGITIPRQPWTDLGIHEIDHSVGGSSTISPTLFVHYLTFWFSTIRIVCQITEIHYI